MRVIRGADVNRCPFQPIGVSTYRVTRQLPEPLRTEIPSIEDLKEVAGASTKKGPQRKKLL
jgi:hypothetical protein